MAIPKNQKTESAREADAPALLDSWSTIPSAYQADPTFVGAKALGLFRLPRAWVPRFIVFTAPLCERLADLNDTARVWDLLSTDEAELLAEYVAEAAQGGSRPSAQLLVRSNAVAETLQDRGRYRSYHVPADVHEIARAAQMVVKQNAAGMRVILQYAISPNVPGHMSNERRLTPDPKRWLIEGLPHERGGVTQEFIRADKNSRVDILQATEADVRRQLRRVAGRLTTLGSGLYHCEWTWDGRRIWIVQCDDASVPVRTGSKSGNDLLTAPERAPEPLGALGVLKKFSNAPAEWSKLACPQLFNRIGLPTSEIFFVRGTEWLSPLTRAQILSDLEELCRQPTVIRTDVRNDAGISDLLLPTSKASKDPHELACFMDEATKFFEGRSIQPDKWAFLPARLVPARASAMVHAFPNAQYVHVDALWGYPDGLLHYGHDTYYYFVEEGRIDKHIRHKGLAVFPERESWTTRDLDPPFDWARVLEDEEIITLANWALTLANTVGQQVQLMALARIGGGQGASACLPWHYTLLDIPPYTQSALALPGGVQAVRNFDDIKQFRRKEGQGLPTAYHIKPDVEFLRRDDFLAAAGQLAADQRRRLYFEGSLQAHAYYVLERTGATVVPVTNEPKRYQKSYNKIVRDLIPMIIRNAGSLARVRRIPRTEAVLLLKQKLIEEAFEVRNARRNQLVDELADVLDVIDAIRDNSGVDFETMENARRKKREKRGGFQDLVYLENTDIRSLKAPPSEQGRIPLFGDEPTAPGQSRRLNRAELRLEKPGKDDGMRFSFPLVPPPVGGDATMEFVTEHDDSTQNSPQPFLDKGPLRLSIRYSGDRVVVCMSKTRQEIGADTQLSLPLTDD